LILLDITFPPDVGGVVGRFSHHGMVSPVEAIKKIPVIIITGTEDSKNKQRAVSCGAVAFFPQAD
jgi:CheY-like chemotaxis protein